MSVNSFDNYYMSWTPVLKKDGGPYVTQLVDQLQADIRERKLLPGTKLPPYRELADYLDVNVSTITRAFKTGREKGLLSGSVGSATYVSYDALANVSMSPPVRDSVIPLGALYPAVHSSGQTRSILRMMIAEPGFDRWMGYGAFHGTENQRLAALPILQKAGLQTAQERLIPAGGGQNAIAGILCGLFERGDRLGVDPLTYPGLKTTAKMFGVELIPVRHENGEISEEGLLYALRNEKIRGIYVMPDVQNPTTHVMSEACRAMIAEVAKQKDLLVIEDGANSLTLSETHQAIANLAPEHTVYIGSLSKAIAPALRLAYVASPERFEAPLKDAFHNINLMLSPFLSEFASRMLASDDVLEVIENNRREAVRRNRIFDREMEGYEAAGTDECLFRWLTLPKEIDGAEFERRALEAGVDVYAGYRFAVGKTKPPSALRIAVTSPKTDEDLIEALTKLKQLIEKY